MMVLYSGTTCPYSHRCRFVLFEKGMDFEIRDVDLYNKREDISEAIEKAQPAPNRKRGTVVVKDLDSLLLLCKDQFPLDSFIYADPDARKITAVFNDTRGTAAGWRDHRAEFKAEYTPEFDNWLRNNRQTKEQGAFAEFIEDNFADLAGDDAQTLLDVATTIQAKTNINFGSAKRLQNGQVQLTYTEDIDARAGAAGALEIPKEFTLGLRIFKNGDGYKLRAEAQAASTRKDTMRSLTTADELLRRDPSDVDAMFIAGTAFMTNGHEGIAALLLNAARCATVCAAACGVGACCAASVAAARARSRARALENMMPMFFSGS